MCDESQGAGGKSLHRRELERVVMAVAQGRRFAARVGLKRRACAGSLGECTALPSPSWRSEMLGRKVG